jgi:hypothetical protein
MTASLCFCPLVSSAGTGKDFPEFVDAGELFLFTVWDRLHNPHHAFGSIFVETVDPDDETHGEIPAFGVSSLHVVPIISHRYIQMGYGLGPRSFFLGRRKIKNRKNALF